MTQASLFPVNIVHKVDPSLAGVDGADLKWLAQGDDGHTYAMKTLNEHPALPMTEWVCYRLWKDCGLFVPDCAALHEPGQPPAFGSRFEQNALQLQHNPNAYTIAALFASHLREIGAIYPMDAFITNNDRHGRNLLVRQTVMGNVLLSIDFSRAAMVMGKPFGKQTLLQKPCNTLDWWRYFRDQMHASADLRALQSAAALPMNWLEQVVDQAPPEWSASIDRDKLFWFWKKRRTSRVKFAKMWL
jgi:hypothetical protein